MFTLQSQQQRLQRQLTVTPGVHADFDREGKIIGIEVIDATEVVGGKIEFKLPQVVHSTAKLQLKIT